MLGPVCLRKSSQKLKVVRDKRRFWMHLKIKLFLLMVAFAKQIELENWIGKERNSFLVNNCVANPHNPSTGCPPKPR